MRPIAPRLEGYEEVTIAEEQEEYAPITVARRASPTFAGATELVTRWTFTPEERAQIASGADILVTQLVLLSMVPMWAEVHSP